MRGRFTLLLADDAQALLRVLAPFAVRGHAPRRLALRRAGGGLEIDIEFDDLTAGEGEWYCAKLAAAPFVGAVRHRPLPGSCA